MSRSYPIKYRIELGNFSAEELRADEELGGCDSIFFGSILYGETGEMSITLLPLDGRTKKEMTSKEMFQVWTMLGKILNGRYDLGKMRHYIAGLPFDMTNETFEKDYKA